MFNLYEKNHTTEDEDELFVTENIKCSSDFFFK